MSEVKRQVNRSCTFKIIVAPLMLMALCFGRPSFAQSTQGEILLIVRSDDMGAAHAGHTKRLSQEVLLSSSHRSVPKLATHLVHRFAEAETQFWPPSVSIESVKQVPPRVRQR